MRSSRRKSPMGTRGMAALEKLFLGCMLLFGSFILAGFSMYFDVTNICRGSFDRSSGITIGMAECARDRAYRDGAAREIMPYDNVCNATFGLPRRVSQMVGSAFAPPVENEGATVVRSARKTLLRKGIRNERLLAMLSKAAFRLPLERALATAERLVAAEDLAGAAARLERAVAVTAPDDLITLAALLERLALVQMDRKTWAAARRTGARLESVRRQILNIRKGAQV